MSVCLSVCPCVVTLTVAFLCRFSPNLTQRCKPPKVRTSSLGSISPHPFLYFTRKNRHFWPRAPENPCKYEKRNICLKCSRIAKIPASYRKSGSGNTMVMSDFWQEVEIWQNALGIQMHIITTITEKVTIYVATWAPQDVWKPVTTIRTMLDN